MYILLLLSIFTSVRGEAAYTDRNIVYQKGEWKYLPKDVFDEKRTPPKPFDDRWQSRDSTIVILIAALRENRLVDTVLSALDNAQNPERVFFGVIQQNHPLDEDVVEGVCKRRGTPVVLENGKYINQGNCIELSRIRIIRMLDSEAKGPVFARGHQVQLIENDDFCLEIDAHTIFKKNWDSDLLSQWGATENEFAVLSTYPTNWKDLDLVANPSHVEMPHLCGVQMDRKGYISNKQASAVANMDRPVLSPVWAAGLSFSRCHAERRSPTDINLKHVFAGEEISRAVRLWTHGYDFYSITKPILGVYYGNEKNNHGSWRGNSSEEAIARKRIQTLLKLPESDQSLEALNSLGRYGLGTKRSLEQYIAFSGINTIQATEEEKCIVYYVPWLKEDDTTCAEIAADERTFGHQYGRKSLYRPYCDTNLRLELVSNSNQELFYFGESKKSLGALVFIMAIAFVAYVYYLRVVKKKSQYKR